MLVLIGIVVVGLVNVVILFSLVVATIHIGGAIVDKMQAEKPVKAHKPAKAYACNTMRGIK